MVFSPFIRTAGVALLVGAGLVVWGVQPNRSPEYELKARLLRNVGGYVTWPGTLQREGQPFVIGVLGESPFERFLDEQAKGKVVHNRKVNIVYLRTLHPDSILACDILFICDSEFDRVMDVLRICKGKPILTVADTHGFGNRGVILNMVVSTDQVGFEVNTRMAREAGLEISSSLLASPRVRLLN